MTSQDEVQGYVEKVESNISLVQLVNILIVNNCRERQEQFIIVFHLRTTSQKKDALQSHLLSSDLPMSPIWRFRMNEMAMLG